MATAEQNLAKFQEISNRGLQDQLSPEIRVRFDEAVKRGMVTSQQVATDATSQQAQSSAQGQAVAPIEAEPAPFFEAPEFVGESFFEQRRVDLEKQQKESRVAQRKSFPFNIQAGRAAGQEQSRILEDIRENEAQRQKFITGIPEEIQNLPELMARGEQGGEKLTGALISGLLASKEGDRLAILENFGWKVEMVRGFPKITNPETGEEFQLNKPGLSQRDLIDFVSTGLQFLPAAKVTGLVKGITKRAVTGAATAGLTEIAKQSIEVALGGEFDLTDVGITALFGAGAELAIPALRGIWNKLTPKGREKLLAAKTVEEIKALGVSSVEELKNIQEIVDQVRTAQKGIKDLTGVEVDIFRGQATGLPSDTTAQRLLLQLDVTSRKALEGLRTQNKQAFDAAIGILDTIAPSEVIEVAGKSIRSASQAAIAAKKLIREQATSPLYDAAKAASKENPILIPEFIKSVDDQIKALDPAEKLKGVLNDFKGRVTRSGGDLKKLQRAKFFLEDEIARFTDKPLGSHDKRVVRGIREQFLKAIDDESTLFREANEEFARLSGPVDELLDSAIGKAANLTDDQLDTATSIFFNKNTTPAAINRARKLIEQQDPEAWNQIVRRELHNRVGGFVELAEDQGIDQIANVPSKLRTAIFGNDTKRAILMRSVDAETRRNLNWLDTVLSSTATGRAAGSPTAPFGVIIDKLKGSSQKVQQAVSAPLKTLAGAGQEAFFRRNARALMDLMYDPRWLERMSRIRALDPSSSQSGKQLSNLLDDALRVSVQAEQSRQSQPTQETKTQ